MIGVIAEHGGERGTFVLAHAGGTNARFPVCDGLRLGVYASSSAAPISAATSVWLSGGVPTSS
jgi:hypothetical protein